MTNHIFARQIRKLAKRIFESNYQVILQWVPSNSNINKIANTGHNQILVESSAITFDYVKDHMNKNMLTTWMNQWEQCKSKGKYYEKFEIKPGISRFYLFIKQLFEIDICYYYAINKHNFVKWYEECQICEQRISCFQVDFLLETA